MRWTLEQRKRRKGEQRGSGNYKVVRMVDRIYGDIDADSLLREYLRLVGAAVAKESSIVLGLQEGDQCDSATLVELHNFRIYFLYKGQCAAKRLNVVG